MSQPDKAAVIASWLSGRGGVFGPPYDDDAEGLIRALYRAGYVITVNNGEGEIAPRPDRPAGRMSLWQAVRFVGHYRWGPSWHAEGTYYDEAADVACCPCGKTWPPR